MLAVVTVDGESVESRDGDNPDTWLVDNAERVHVSLAGEARCNGDADTGAEWRCVGCGVALIQGSEPLAPSEPGVCAWKDVEDESTTCTYHRCLHCHGSGDVCVPCADPESVAEGDTCKACDGAGFYGHEPEPVPLSWANSAAIDLDPEQDRISVRISVGDPRGAFVMTVERMDDGELRLSLPHPDHSLIHLPLTALASPGYYRIGD